MFNAARQSPSTLCKYSLGRVLYSCFMVIASREGFRTNVLLSSHDEASNSELHDCFCTNQNAAFKAKVSIFLSLPILPIFQWQS